MNKEISIYTQRDSKYLVVSDDCERSVYYCDTEEQILEAIEALYGRGYIVAEVRSIKLKVLDHLNKSK